MGLLAIGAAVGAHETSQGVKAQARAAQGAALARQNVATQQLEFNRQTQRQLLAAAERPEDLARIDRAIATQERSIARQEKLIEALDPSILEASKQALSLLKGEEAPGLTPLSQQRARQREKLVARLREQLGPGAETSSLGLQALQQFDQGTSETLFGARQQSIATALGAAQTFSGIRPNVGAETANLANLSNIGFNRRSQALTAGGQLVNVGFGSALQTAGAGFTEAQIRGQGRAATGRQLTEGAFNLGGQVLGFASGGDK